MIDVSTWCTVITKGVSVYAMAARACKKAVCMAGLPLFFLSWAVILRENAGWLHKTIQEGYKPVRKANHYVYT